MPEKTVKVKVIDRWRVVHEGKPYHKSATLTVPECRRQLNTDQCAATEN